jgi:hypothetical protein
MHEVALDPGLIPRPGLATQQSCHQCPKSRSAASRATLGPGGVGGGGALPPGDVAPCGHKSPVNHNLFVNPGVIHGGTRGLVAAQTGADYFCGAA